MKLLLQRVWSRKYGGTHESRIEARQSKKLTYPGSCIYRKRYQKPHPAYSAVLIKGQIRSADIVLHCSISLKNRRRSLWQLLTPDGAQVMLLYAACISGTEGLPGLH